MSHGKNTDKGILRIFLVGFMCSGKTTFGKRLAEILSWEFIDIDKEIEKKEGMSIPEIFEKRGEDYFRKLEMETLKDLSEKERAVISTGGGLGASEEAMKLMKEKGLVVWLKVSFEEFLRRCGKDDGRPLLKRGKEFLKELLKKRESVYSKAHIHIEEFNLKDMDNAIKRVVESLLFTNA